MGGVGLQVVLEGDPLSNVGLCLCPGFPSVQMDTVTLEGPAKALDEDVVPIGVQPPANTDRFTPNGEGSSGSFRLEQCI